jgi:hypothetical protein
MRPRFACWALLLAVGIATTGCAQRYLIVKTDGTRLITASRPKLVESKYVYRDATGQVVEVPKMRVRLIEPYSEKAAGVQRQLPDLLP